jgi:hypothetical protein
MSPDGLPEHWVWRDGPVAGGPAVVFDVDGVLADAAGRQHYLEGGRRDWKAFFDACGDDPLVEEVARLLHLLDASLTIVLLTARPQTVMPQTMGWLTRYGVRWDLLVMRPTGRQLPAIDFKRQAVEHLRDAGFALQLAFEDDQRNVAMLRDEGIPTVYIHSGYYL